MENKGFPRPFAGNYGVMLTVAILAISPFIVITTASGLHRPQVASDLGTNLTALSVISGIATAGYAFFGRVGRRTRGTAAAPLGGVGSPHATRGTPCGASTAARSGCCGPAIWVSSAGKRLYIAR
jgi:hypothetical protein